MFTLVRLLIIVVSSILLFFGIEGLNKGSVRGKYGTVINRDESPFTYWLSVGTFLVAGIGGIIFAIAWGFMLRNS